MKKTQTLILLSSLIASTAAFSASGAVPHCRKGALNIEVYDKDLVDDDCYSLNGKGNYCIYDMSLRGEGPGGDTCADSNDSMLEKNTNESYSFSKVYAVHLTHYLYRKGKAPTTVKLHFDYSHGVLTNNCAQVFGPDAQCITTKLGSKKHPLYLVTIRNT